MDQWTSLNWYEGLRAVVKRTMGNATITWLWLVISKTPQLKYVAESFSNFRVMCVNRHFATETHDKYTPNNDISTTITTSIATANEKKKFPSKKGTRSDSSKQWKLKEEYSEMSFEIIKKTRSLHIDDRLDELLEEIEGCKWDVILLSETWRTAKTRHGSPAVLSHLHGRQWLQSKTSSRRIVLISIYFLRTGHTDDHIEKTYKCIENHCKENHTTMIADDFNVQLGSDDESESVHVEKDALRESNKLDTCMKQWLMIQNYET